MYNNNNLQLLDVVQVRSKQISRIALLANSYVNTIRANVGTQLN
jgi:hypothetical protein